MNSIDKITEMAEYLKQAKSLYYSGTPIISDEEFDRLEEELRAKAPDHEYFSIVGTPVEGEKIEHPFPMLSMGKAKDSRETLKWGRKIGVEPNEPMCIEPKIDGLSAECFYKDGKLQWVASRGDGKKGQNISHIAQHIADIKAEVPFPAGYIYIRGELHLPKVNLITEEKLRNTCAGIINRKDNFNALKHVRFIVYEMYGDHGHDSVIEMLNTLASWGFYTVPYTMIRMKEIEATYREYLDSKRETWDFETDGLIVTVNDTKKHGIIDSKWVVDHHHHYNIALKPPSKSEWTTLTGVEWNVSKNGYLVPVALMRPVTIDGITIERATLNNAKMIQDLNLGIGDDIELMRANDVIPYVNNVHRTDKWTQVEIPEQCPACDFPTEWFQVHIRCSNDDCPERKIQLITAWCKKSGMLGISEQAIRRMWDDVGIRNIADLYRLTPDFLLQINGWKEKMAWKIYDTIQSHRDFEGIEVLAMLAIPLVGRRALEKLRIFTIEDFTDFNDPSTKIGENIIKWKANIDNLHMLLEILLEVNIVEKEEEVPVKENALNIAITGTGPLPRAEIIDIIRKRGDVFKSSVTKDTDILLCADPESGSSKMRKAKERGVAVTSYEAYLNEEE